MSWAALFSTNPLVSNIWSYAFISVYKNVHPPLIHTFSFLFFYILQFMFVFSVNLIIFFHVVFIFCSVLVPLVVLRAHCVSQLKCYCSRMTWFDLILWLSLTVRWAETNQRSQSKKTNPMGLITVLYRMTTFSGFSFVLCQLPKGC